MMWSAARLGGGEMAEDTGERRSRVRWVLAGVIVLVLVLFMAGNSQTQEVQFLFLEWDVALWLALLIAAVLGLAVGYVAGRAAARD
jgi:uncharacterized integral membrane protein